MTNTLDKTLSDPKHFTMASQCWDAIVREEDGSRIQASLEWMGRLIATHPSAHPFHGVSLFGGRQWRLKSQGDKKSLY